jgi:hypothetical protein
MNVNIEPERKVESIMETVEINLDEITENEPLI